MNPNHLARFAVVILVIAAVAIVLRLKQADSSSSTHNPSGAVSSMVLTDQSSASPQAAQPDETDFERALRSRTDPAHADAALPRLLDLGADKCIPCKKMAPILEALRADFAGQFDVVFIDVWKDQRAAGPYGIRLIPTQIFFDEAGKELFRHQGFFSREDILGAWSDLGYEFAVSSRSAHGANR